MAPTKSLLATHIALTTSYKMKTKTISIFNALLLTLALSQSVLVFSAIPAYAAEPNSIAKGQICEPVQTGIESTQNLKRCVNNIYLFSVAVVGVVSVLMLVIAGYMYMAGTQESVKKAKQYVTSTLAAILILLGAYLILNTIDPNLTRIYDLNFPAIDCAKQPEQCKQPEYQDNTTTTNLPPGSNAITIASRLNETDAKFYTSHASGVRDNATAYQNIADTIAGKPATRSAYGNAPGGTIPLDSTMLSGLYSAATRFSIGVSEIAGGEHSATSAHYKGKAFDINYANTKGTKPLIHMTGTAPKSLIDGIMNACRAAGGTALDETKTANHVHCQWN